MRGWQVAAALAAGILTLSVAGTASAAVEPVHVPKCDDLKGTCAEDPKPQGGPVFKAFAGPSGMYR
jgi:hypothetical protein